MGSKSSIEWTDATCSPLRARIKPDAVAIAKAKGYTSLVTILEARKPNGELRSPPGKIGPHCERVSPGCGDATGGGCYSEANNHRCLPSNGTGLPFDRRSRDLVDVFLDEKILMQPLHWKAPKRIFWCSQTDLFGEFVRDDGIDQCFAVMALTPHHTHLVLTKRAERMREYMTSRAKNAKFWKGACPVGWSLEFTSPLDGRNYSLLPFPLPNVMLGVSVEDQQRADERIPLLLQTPAAGRFLSAEPLLGPINLYCGLPTLEIERESGMWRDLLRWVIVGGESGPGARPMHPAWARAIRDQCVAAGVPFFFKQWGEWAPPTADALRVWWSALSRPSEMGPRSCDFGDGDGAVRVGKKAAGRLLDGRTWDEMPKAPTQLTGHTAGGR